jgi:hypothetical protein
MWPPVFEERLQEWHDLRLQCRDLDLPQALEVINNWWWRAPMVNYYLHWDDRRGWPGPWDLLADNVFCDLARAVGMLYTVMIVDRSDVHDIQLAQTQDDNLVLVNQGIYVMNWAPGELLNIASLPKPPRKFIDGGELRHLLG